MTSNTDNRTLTLNLVVHIIHEAEVTYDDFKEKVMNQYPHESDEAFERRSKEQWERLMKDYEETAFELEEIEAPCDWVCDDLEEIQHWTSDVADQLGVETKACPYCEKKVLTYDNSNDLKICKKCETKPVKVCVGYTPYGEPIYQ